MKENTATIEVEGPMARNVAASVLDALALEAGDVQQMEVVLRTVSDEADSSTTTDTSFQTSGPNAGDVAHSMLGAVDDDKHVPEYINVNVTVAEETDEDDTDESEQYIQSHSRSEGERAMPDDFATEDSPATSVTRLTFDSKCHQAVAVVAAYESKHPDEDGALVTDMAQDISHPFAHRDSLSSALSSTFRKKGYLDRDRESQSTGGVQCRYWMDEMAWDELERLGWPESVPPVKNQPATDGGMDDDQTEL